MHKDEQIALAQNLARTISQFRKLKFKKNSNEELRHSEFMLLSTIRYYMKPNSRGIKVSDLSTKLQITPAAVTHMINALEEGGYLDRLADPEDRRIVLIKATNKGNKVVELMEKEFFKRFQGLVEFLGEQDSKELNRLLSLTFTYFKERGNNNAD